MGETAARFEFDVVVVGGGPVGTLLAAELRKGGVSVLVLEARTDFDLLPRAGSMGPLAFEAVDRAGLHDEVLAAEQATLAQYARMFAEWSSRSAGADGGGKEGEGKGVPAAEPSRKAPKEHFGGLERIDPSRRSFPERRRVRIEQPVLEEILFRNAERLGAVIRRGHRLVGLEQDEELVALDVDTPEGRRRVECQYVVGCDGADSTVRGLAGFDFPGTDPSVTGRMAVVEMADAEKLAPGFHFTDRGLYVHGLGLNRLSTVEFDGAPDGGLAMDLPELQDSIRRVSGTDVTLTSMDSGTRWIDTARQASRYRIGRVLLAGDAAHVYAPVGGQGLNVGLVDAANLGWKLAAQINRWAPFGLLDSYQAERHPVARRLLQNTRAQIALMRPDPQSTALRELLDELFDIDDVHRLIADMLAGMDVRYPVAGDHPLAGTLLPDRKLAVESGPADGAAGTARLAELLRPGRGLLIDLAGRAELRRAARPWAARVDVVTVRPEDDRSPDGPAAVDALLVRPDGCVAWVLPAGPADGEPASSPALADALRTWFGRPAEVVDAA